MKTEISIDTIMKMGCDARSESMKFETDVFNNLLAKYKGLRDRNEYIEDSTRKILDKQIELAIKNIAELSSNLSLLELMSEIINKPHSPQE